MLERLAKCDYSVFSSPGAVGDLKPGCTIDESSREYAQAPFGVEAVPKLSTMSASATIHPKGPPAEFKFIDKRANGGAFEGSPTQQGEVVNWKISRPFSPEGALDGYVKYGVEGYGAVWFRIVHPAGGDAKCEYWVEESSGGGKLGPSCSIGEQYPSSARASFDVQAYPRPPVKGHLTVTVRIPIKCDAMRPVEDCPHGTNMLTKVSSAGMSPDEFPAAGRCCGEIKKEFEINIGQKYRIDTRAAPDTGDGYYIYEETNIQGSAPFGTGECTAKGKNVSCEATMEPSGANVIVNYHYAR